MISSVRSSTLVARLEQIEQEGKKKKVFGWTPAQIKNFALKAIAGSNLSASLGVGVCALSGAISPWALFSAPFFLGLGASTLVCSEKVRDYADPNALKKYRNEPMMQLEEIKLETRCSSKAKAKAKTVLKDVVKMHGWKSMFYYAIPLPEDFATLYSFQNQYLNPLESVEFYLEAKKGLEEASNKHGAKVAMYRIPPLHISREKWKAFPIRKTLTYPHVGKLIESGVLSPSKRGTFLTLKKEYMLLQAKFRDYCSQYENRFTMKRHPVYKKMEKDLRYLDELYEAHPAHKVIHKICQDQVKEEETMRQKERDELKKSRQRLEELEEKMRRMDNDDPLFQKSLQQAKEAFQEKKKALRFKNRSTFREIQTRYDSRRKPYVRQLRVARKRRDAKKASIHKKYDQEIWVLQNQADSFYNREKNRYQSELKTIEKKLCCLFSY